MIDQMTDFFKGRTTVTSRLQKASELEPPTITICLDPPFKTSVAKIYDFASKYDIFAKDVPNTTYEERFENLSYNLIESLQIKLSCCVFDGKQVVLNLGTNGIKDQWFDVKPLQTVRHGTCYTILPRDQVRQLPWYAELYLSTFNVSKIDQPKQFIIYLTSNNTYQNIATGDWPNFVPSEAKIDVQASYDIDLKPTEYLFNQGIESSEKCWMNEIADSTCQSKCRFTSFAPLLPMCKTLEDLLCILDFAYTNNVYSRCNRKKRGLTFIGQMDRDTRFKKSNMTRVGMGLWSMTKEIREEVDIITLPGLIGSVGGSLGMFFGFSIANYLLFWTDILIDRFATFFIK